MRLLKTIFLCLFAKALFSQSAWNNFTFKFTTDTISLESMVGATSITFKGNIPLPTTSGLFNFPEGFTFKYGLRNYTDLSVSPHGFIRLGSDISNNEAALQTDVIAPLTNPTSWDVSYKITGTAPNRKFIMEWDGVMQPTGEPTKFQLWLTERIGKIEFIYESVESFQYDTFTDRYFIFCKTDILGKGNLASAQVLNNKRPTAAIYGAIFPNLDTIYPNTRYTWQPDTIKPAAPTNFSFANVSSGCLSVNFTDISNTESVIQLERASDQSNFILQNQLYTSTASVSGNQSFYQSNLEPLWPYRYRIYSSNGFLNSDTVTADIQTLTPILTGIKRIPGDYPSITALLADVACKNIGPDLIIEMTTGYSFANETLPLVFNQALKNRLYNSITIRPAINTTILWSANTLFPFFRVDSLKKVILDGRPGGLGSTRAFTIVQQNGAGKAIQYFNAADSGTITYCNIYGNPSADRRDYLVTISGYAINGVDLKKNVDAFTLSNCLLASNNGAMPNLIGIISRDSTGAKNCKIINNEFTRFKRDAVYISGGADRLLITGNHFYQTDPISAIGYYPYSPFSTCLNLVDLENIVVRENYFGGSSPNWGSGRYTISAVSPESDYHFVNYNNSLTGKNALFSSNKFGNIYSPAAVLISANGGNVTIDSNIVGTLDSINSIETGSVFIGIEVSRGIKRIANNFFSSLQGALQTDNYNAVMYIITSHKTDTAYILDNDIGGTNNVLANAANITIAGISAGKSDNVAIIKRNKIHGWYSRRGTVVGVNSDNAISDSYSSSIVDSNQIHHLRGGATAIGITGSYNSRKTNVYSNNEIYALEVEEKGVSYYYLPTGTVKGISIWLYNYPKYFSFEGMVDITGNRIHSLKPLRTTAGAEFYIQGIYFEGSPSRIWNNNVRLGLDTKGLPIDTTYTSIQGILVGGGRHFVEHNSVYIGGRGYPGTGIQGIQSRDFPGSEITVSNNIIQIDRAHSDPTITPTFQTYDFKAISAKNVWHSENYQVNGKLQTFKQNCNCDLSSFVGNPQLINPKGDSTHYSLALLPGSVADAAGTPPFKTIDKDIDGLERRSYSPVDIGSHASIPCQPDATGIISIATPLADTTYKCPGSSVVINATVAGSNFQQLQWQRNMSDIPSATGLSFTASNPGIYRLIGKNNCGVATSRSILIVDSVNSIPVPSITIGTPTTTVCSGVQTNFGATVTNAGASPTFQWKKNNTNVGTNNNFYRPTDLVNGDIVSVVMTSSAACAAPRVVTSNLITMSVTPSVTPSITISGNTMLDAGASTTLTATAVNPGSNSTYQWQDSIDITGWRSIANATSLVYTYTPVRSLTKIRCVLNTTYTCANPKTAISPALILVFNTITAVSTINAIDYGITFYPNPASSFIILDSLQIRDQWKSADLITQDGKIIFTTKIAANQTKLVLDIKNFSQGVYFILLRNRTGRTLYLKISKI